jgi:NitT/TauT family transport system ATP-binding protein
MNQRNASTGGAHAVPPDTAPAIRVDKVAKTFHSNNGTDVTALRDISLQVASEEFVALLGPSGCGKTTVLRLVDGLIKPDEGSVNLFGSPPEPGPNVGFVFQSFRLIPWANVEQNVEFALRSLALDAAERRERARHHIERVGLTQFAKSYPGELSGGMKQRVALARALSTEPRVLLMDEPFASIDAQTRELMQMETLQIFANRKPTVIFVTHSVDEAIVLADRIVLMGPRPGRIVEEVPVSLDRPRWEYDARADKRYVELRSYLSRRMRELVLADPSSEFFGRQLSLPA